MKFLSATIVLAAVASAAAYRSEFIETPETTAELVVSPRPSDYIRTDDLPESWDWRNVDGVSYVSPNLNQHIPVYCGSCWAHAAMSTVADRIRIMTKNSRSDIIPSIQALINCGTAGTCNGGSSGSAFKWMSRNPMPDTTCQQYEATNNECSDFNWCRNCDSNGTCWAMPAGSFPLISVSEYGIAKGDEGIMKEIYARGPVAASLNALCLEDASFNPATEVCMYDTCQTHMDNHEIQIAGWGVQDGTPYWLIRNSWGTYWGDNGWSKVVRGGNWKPRYANWAVPDLSTYVVA